MGANGTDGFIKFSNVLVPNTLMEKIDASLSLDECRDHCLRNCLCTGYTNVNVRNGGSGCVMWLAELNDIVKYVDAGQDLYIRLAAADLGCKMHRNVEIGSMVAEEVMKRRKQSSDTYCCACLQVRETMEKAFWDGIMDSMKEDSPDYSRILGLVKEVRDELIGMAPKSWKQDILDSVNMDILSQLLKSGTQDMEYLGRILEHALLMLQKLSAEAKEVEMKKAHDKLLMELAAIAQSDGKEKNSFVTTVIRGLRFVLEEIQVLKTEINNARMQIIKASGGLEYLQKAFADRYGPAHGAANSLPLTAQWILSLGSSSEDECNEHNDSVSRTSTSHGLPIGTALRTGGNIPLAWNNSPPRDSGDEEQPEWTGEKLDLLLRLGVLQLASGIEGLTTETVPETLELNVLRLRSVQSQLQQIIVISTSMLVLRQILLSENSALPASVLENTISDSIKRLTEVLHNVPDVGVEGVINTIAGSSSESKFQSIKEMMARVLTKSLQSNDPVFMKVSSSIYLAARAVVLGGSGNKGQKLAEATLKRVGAAMLLDQVVKAAKVLVTIATVSGRVHGPWYRSLI